MTENQIRSAFYCLTLTLILANCATDPVFSARSAVNGGMTSKTGPKPETSTVVQPGAQSPQAELKNAAVNLLTCTEGTDCYEEPIPVGAEMECASNKVLVCKIPPGNPSGQREHCYPPPAVSAHIASGSHLGMCN